MKAQKRMIIIALFAAVVGVALAFGLLVAKDAKALSEAADYSYYDFYVYFFTDDAHYPLRVETSYNEWHGDGVNYSTEVKSSTDSVHSYWGYQSSDEIIYSITMPDAGNFSYFYVERIPDSAPERKVCYSTREYNEICEGDAQHKLTEDGKFTVNVYLYFGPPTCTLTGVTNGGYTNGASVSYSCPRGLNVLVDDVQSADSGTIYNEGYHTIKLTDVGGKSAEYSFKIDRTAPEGELQGVTNGGRTNTNVKFSWSDGEATAKLNGNSYSSGTEILQEGNYSIELTDRANNQTRYTFVVDKTPPKITGYRAFVNSRFTLTAEDALSPMERWEYSVNGGGVQRADGASISFGGGVEGNGSYKIRISDVVGNSTGWMTVTHVYRPNFGNFSKIINTFIYPNWYIVTLPQRIFTAQAGSYAFKNRDDALNWAISKEWQYRVSEIDGGKWSYVNAANESVYQIYEDRAQLDEAVLKYASAYVSGRKTLATNGKFPDNPVLSDGTPSESALTFNEFELPKGLEAYADLPRAFVMRDYYLNKPSEIVDGNTCTITAKLLYNGVSIVGSPEVTLSYGVEFNKAVDLTETALTQGYYLITEKDLCGNVEKYILCVDMGEPQATAKVTDGKGDEQQITFTKEYVTKNSGIMSYVSLDFEELSDVLDKYVMLKLDGRGIDGEIYVKGDELPRLSYDDGRWGEYTVTLYDRSLNILEFTVKIAGEAPTVGHSSLTSEYRLVLTININDKNNALTSVRLFKVMYSGERVEKKEDDEGTPVNEATLSYILTVGGKYVLQFTDIYGRTIESEELFYMKGLPSGTLKGVKENGVTNGDVTFEYSPENGVIVYYRKNDAWENYSDAVISDGAVKCTAQISASAAASFKYKIFLYVLADMNLFTEYQFEIDCIPPAFTVYDENGGKVPADGVTNKTFYVTWSEAGCNMNYYKDSAGTLGTAKYTKEKMISEAGIYVFTLSDAAKNVSTFTVTLDNAVSYTVDSNSYRTRDDGALVSRSYITLTVAEKTRLWNVTSDNGIKPVNGQKIDINGTYTFDIEDMYGNTLHLVIIIDNLPPVPVFTDENGEVLADGSRTNRSFTVTCEEEGAVITYSFNNGGYAAYNGELISLEGAHSFKLTDIEGNNGVYTITIDRSIEVSISGKYVERGGVIYSKDGVRLSVDEDYKSFVISKADGGDIDVTSKISEEGTYTARWEDLAGNVRVLTVVIDQTPPEAIAETESGERIELNGRVKSPFRVYTEEEDAVILCAKGFGERTEYRGQYLSEAGVYNFTATDFLGNTAEFKIIVDFELAFTVNGVYVMDDGGNYHSKSWLSIKADEEVSVFECTDENGNRYPQGEKLTAEGKYHVLMRDDIGNAAEFDIFIDHTPPAIAFDGVQTGGATSGTVTVKTGDAVEAYYTNGTDQLKHYIEDGEIIDEEGEYTVTAKDLAGNVAEVNFKIDRHVEVKLTRAISEGQLLTGTIGFDFDENVAATLAIDGVESGYNGGEISGAGAYALKATDDLGNVYALSFRILAEKARSYDFEVADCDIEIMRDGSYIDNVARGGRVALTEKGAYTLTVNKDGEAYELLLTVDNTPPSVEIIREGNSIRIGSPSKNALSYTLYKDGAQIDFSPTETITEIGDYKLIVSDELGNESIYTFDLHFFNVGSILLIVFGALLVSAAVFLVIFMRVKQRIK